MLEIVVREGQLTLVRAVQPSNRNVSTTETRLGSDSDVIAVQPERVKSSPLVWYAVRVSEAITVFVEKSISPSVVVNAGAEKFTGPMPERIDVAPATELRAGRLTVTRDATLSVNPKLALLLASPILVRLDRFNEVRFGAVIWNWVGTALVPEETVCSDVSVAVVSRLQSISISTPTVVRLVIESVIRLPHEVRFSSTPIEVREFASRELIELPVNSMLPLTVVSDGNEQAKPPEDSKLMLVTEVRSEKSTEEREEANRQKMSPDTVARSGTAILDMAPLFLPSKSPTTVVNAGADKNCNAGQSPKKNPVKEFAVKAGTLIEVNTVLRLAAKIVHV
jgi:hypothetical protein